jgi:hypothetical protein
VLVGLSQAQVDGVLRDASAADHISMLLMGAPDLRDLRALVREQQDAARLSRSLIYGLMLLAALPADGCYASLTALARSLDMSMSSAHRYVSTLLAVGLVERDPLSRQYRLAYAD